MIKWDPKLAISVPVRHRDEHVHRNDLLVSATLHFRRSTSNVRNNHRSDERFVNRDGRSTGTGDDSQRLDFAWTRRDRCRYVELFDQQHRCDFSFVYSQTKSAAHRLRALRRWQSFTSESDHCWSDTGWQRSDVDCHGLRFRLLSRSRRHGGVERKYFF